MKFAKSHTARVPLGGVFSPAADSMLLMTGLFTAVLTFDKSTSGASLAAGKLYGGHVSKWRDWDEKSLLNGELCMRVGCGGGSDVKSCVGRSRGR